MSNLVTFELRLKTDGQATHSLSRSECPVNGERLVEFVYDCEAHDAINKFIVRCGHELSLSGYYMLGEMSASGEIKLSLMEC
jgi:hypothetical protein